MAEHSENSAAARGLGGEVLALCFLYSPSGIVVNFPMANGPQQTAVTKEGGVQDVWVQRMMTSATSARLFLPVSQKAAYVPAASSPIFALTSFCLVQASFNLSRL